MPSYTFIAGYNAARILGARVLFADIHKGTWTMDPKSVVEIITQRTAVLMPTSLFGQPADMDEYRSLAAGFGCAVLEDAAQSLGAKYKGRKSGNLSQVAVTSFFPTKTLGGYGEGGAVFTDHPAIAARVQAIVQNGLADGTHWHLGLNLRMSNLQAAIVNVKLKYLDYMIHRRRRIARIYGEKLTGTGIGIPYGVDEHAWAVYTIVVPNVLSLERHLREQGIPTKRYYSPPIHMLPVTEGNPQRYTLPVTTNIAAESISLPCSHTTTDEEAEIVAEEVLKWWQS
jgi:UDP-2-acetamido-2-deoxy-ribo-hexuluronate aminotransferase